MSTPTQRMAAGPALTVTPRTVQRRRSRARIAAAVSLVVVFALGGWYFFQSQTAQQPYLAVNRTVEVGGQVGEGDLMVVYLNGGIGLSPIRSADRPAVIGKYATVRLLPGTLLTREQLTDQQIPAPGQQLVGIRLEPAQMPARELRPGDTVELVEIPDPRAAFGGTDGEDALRNPGTTSATVVNVGEAGTAGDRVVDVVVSGAAGPRIAALAAAKRIVLVLTPAS